MKVFEATVFLFNRIPQRVLCLALIFVVVVHARQSNAGVVLEVSASINASPDIMDSDSRDIGENGLGQATASVSRGSETGNSGVRANVVDNRLGRANFTADFTRNFPYPNLSGGLTHDFTLSSPTTLHVEFANRSFIRKPNGDPIGNWGQGGVRLNNSGLGHFNSNQSGRLSFDLGVGDHSLVIYANTLGAAGGAFDLFGESQTIVNWGLGSLPGEDPDSPFLPDFIDLDDFVFDVITDNDVRFYDPEIATGYRYIADGSRFASVLVPGALPNGDGEFELHVGTQVHSLTAGTEFDLTTIDPLGIDSFFIRGIDTSEMLDPTDPTAFVTGLSFVDSGTIARMTMTPELSVSAVPEPTTASMVCMCFALVFVGRRRRRTARWA